MRNVLCDHDVIAVSAYQPSSLLVGKKGAMTGPVTSSSLSSLTWIIDDLERNCQDIWFI